ncbi:MAG: hypothetical protein ACOC2W_00690 [bacterium]
MNETPIVNSLLEEIENDRKSLTQFFKGPFTILRIVNDSVIAKTNIGMYKIYFKYDDTNKKERLILEKIK